VAQQVGFQAEDALKPTKGRRLKGGSKDRGKKLQETPKIGGISKPPPRGGKG